MAERALNQYPIENRVFEKVDALLEKYGARKGFTIPLNGYMGIREVKLYSSQQIPVDVDVQISRSIGFDIDNVIGFQSLKELVSAGWGGRVVLQSSYDKQNNRFLTVSLEDQEKVLVNNREMSQSVATELMEVFETAHNLIQQSSQENQLTLKVPGTLPLANLSIMDIVTEGESSEMKYAIGSVKFMHKKLNIVGAVDLIDLLAREYDKHPYFRIVPMSDSHPGYQSSVDEMVEKHPEANRMIQYFNEQSVLDIDDLAIKFRQVKDWVRVFGHYSSSSGSTRCPACLAVGVNTGEYIIEIHSYPFTSYESERNRVFIKSTNISTEDTYITRDFRISGSLVCITNTEKLMKKFTEATGSTEKLIAGAKISFVQFFMNAVPSEIGRRIGRSRK